MRYGMNLAFVPGICGTINVCILVEFTSQGCNLCLPTICQLLSALRLKEIIITSVNWALRGIQNFFGCLKYVIYF